jgi:hypothetical protein
VSLAFVLIALAILAMVAFSGSSKAKGQSFASTGPSLQLCPVRTGQRVTLDTAKGTVMKVTILLAYACVGS